MNRLVVHFTQTRQANSDNVDGDDRDSGKKAPGKVFEGPTMRQPLAYGHPRYKTSETLAKEEQAGYITRLPD